MALTNGMTSTRLQHYAFRNKGDLTFADETANWGLDKPSFGSGAVYVDLDGDGALDLVVNNVNDTAFVYRNNARSLRKENHYLQVKLEGEGGNRFGVGARVTVESGKDTLYQELSPTRGFESSVDYVLTFGLGKIDTVRSVTVTWPDGRIGVGTNRCRQTNPDQTIRTAARQWRFQRTPPRSASRDISQGTWCTVVTRS
jgi:hypothetical protein